VGAEVRSLEPQLPVVEARFYGGNTRDEMAGAMLECLAIAQDRDIWLLLTDCTDLIKAPTLADIKELIDAVPLMGLDPSFREALVRPTDGGLPGPRSGPGLADLLTGNPAMSAGEQHRAAGHEVGRSGEQQGA
jgi:hypothetical protein